jgi:5-methylcytosine-specific restriction endonuclease McrA
MNLTKYIKSKKWRKRRIQILKRDGFKCRLCNADANDTLLQVHHSTYDRLGNEDDLDLITLCEECHKMFHDYKNKKKKVKKTNKKIR